MGGQPSVSQDRMTIQRALDLARDSEPDSIPPAAMQTLEAAINVIWQRIQTSPDSYVMNNQEFAVFNFFQARFSGNEVARRAIGRYWNQFSGNAPGIDGRNAI